MAAVAASAAMVLAYRAEGGEESALKSQIAIDVYGLPLKPTKQDEVYSLTNYLGQFKGPEVERVLIAIREHDKQRKKTPPGPYPLVEPTACYLVIRSGTSKECEIWSVGQGQACWVTQGRVDREKSVTMDARIGHHFFPSKLNAVVEALIGRLDPELQKAFGRYRSGMEELARKNPSQQR